MNRVYVTIGDWVHLQVCCADDGDVRIRSRNESSVVAAALPGLVRLANTVGVDGECRIVARNDAYKVLLDIDLHAARALLGDA